MAAAQQWELDGVNTQITKPGKKISDGLEFRDSQNQLKASSKMVMSK